MLLTRHEVGYGRALGEWILNTKKLFYIVFIVIVFSTQAYGQAFLDYRQGEAYSSGMTKLIDSGREVYELGFNDGMECLSILILRYKYSDLAEQPPMSELINQCRLEWHVEKRR